MNSCPEMPDLLDHLEGRADFASHVAVCEPCASALSDLRAVLRLESESVAVPALDVERALESVQSRARAGRVRRWRGSFLFSAAAAAALLFLLPGQQIQGPACEGPQHAGGPTSGDISGFPKDVHVELPSQYREMIEGPAVSCTSVAIINSNESRR
jgi:hypothetical protein